MLYQKKGDVVFTPDWVAKDIFDFFKPTGVILDPCRGGGAFHKFMPSGSPFCEITDGKDFLSIMTRLIGVYLIHLILYSESFLNMVLKSVITVFG